MVPLELDLPLVVWVLKHRVPMGRQSHTNLVCSKRPVMRQADGGLGLRFLHLNTSDLGSIPDSVMALLCDLGQMMSSYGW